MMFKVINATTGKVVAEFKTLKEAESYVKRMSRALGYLEIKGRK